VLLEESYPVIKDIIWEYEGRYKAFVTQELSKDAFRNMKYRSQELNLTDSE
jgi:hypothetical protein